MNAGYFNTSSSLYEEDIDFMNYHSQSDRKRRDIEREATMQKLYRTPSPTLKVKKAIHSSGESVGFQDDVYLPYVTPPTPFEKSTQNKSYFSTGPPANPYAQSLWYTSRGNRGDEVDKYGKVTTKLPTSQMAEPIPVLVDSSGKRKELLPSLMLKKHLRNMSSSETNKINIERNSNTTFNRIKSSHAILSDPTPTSGKFNDLGPFDYAESEDEIDALDESILKPLNNPPPFEFISIESQIVKRLKQIYQVSLEFQKYIEQSEILLNNKVKMYLFSNIETLLLIHHKFLDSILNRDAKVDIEELIFDYLQRLYHVYPSYIHCMKLRNHFTKLIIQNQRFKPFVTRQFSTSTHNETWSDDQPEYPDLLHSSQIEFYSLITSPSNDFKSLLSYLDAYISLSSPRISVLIEKFNSCFKEMAYNSNYGEPENNGGQHSQYNRSIDGNLTGIGEYEPLYLEIPSQWKLEHKLNWKEMSNHRTERQLAYYLRHEIKEEFQQYQKLIKLIKMQIDQISKMSICNHYIADKFTAIDASLPKNGQVGDKYTLHLESIDHQNLQIYRLVESFTIFLANERFSLTELMVKEVAKVAKHIFNNDDIQHDEQSSKYNSVVDQIYEIYQFRTLFQEQMYLILVRFISFFQEYVRIMVSDDIIQPPSASSIIDSFQRRIRGLGAQINIGMGNSDNGPWLNEELGRACARDRIIRRFFT